MLLNKLQVYKNILPISFSLIISIMMCTSFFAIFLMNDNSNKIMLALNQQNKSNMLIKEMTDAAKLRANYLFEAFSTDDAFEQDDLFLKFNAAAVKFIVAKNEYGNQHLAPACNLLFGQLDKTVKFNSPLIRSVFDLALSGDKIKAKEFFIKSALPNQKNIFKILDNLYQLEDKLFKNTSSKLQKNSKLVLVSIILLDVVGILFSILLTNYAIKTQRSNDEKLSVIANTDLLTNLPNRANFIEKVNQQISTQPNSTFAVIFFDIDHFKTINDNYGHEAGDQVLKTLSNHITSCPCLGKGDVLSRFGGDEFVLLLRSMTNRDDIRNFLDRLSKRLETSFTINDNEIFVSSSMGASIYPEDANSTAGLLKNADVAMYSAKAAGRSCCRFYTKQAGDILAREHKINHALKTTLNKEHIENDLHLVYQPLYNISNDSVTECEALIRWTNKQGESISPDEFIPLAEKNNLIESINLFVIDEACKQQSEWQAKGIKNIRININLSGNKQIFNNILDHLYSNLEALNLAPSLFGIELTERTLNQVSKSTIGKLEEARNQGMKISIDDFGTDYSSLIYLKRLPVTTLKIDKEFINDLPDDKDNEALVKTIINLAHSLDLDVVAEGIETAAQFEYLKKNDCNIIQGYYLYTPIEGCEFYDLNAAA